MSESSKYIINLNYAIIGLLVAILILLLWHMSKKRSGHGMGCRCRECRYMTSVYAENYSDDE